MVVVNHTHRIAFFGVRKVASTSVKRLFLELDHGAQAASDKSRTDLIHQTYPTSPETREADLAAYRDYWKVTIVRDPVERAMSSYHNRIVQNRDTHRGRFPRLKAALLGIPLDPTPDQFFARIRSYCLQSTVVRNHLALQRVFLGDDLRRYDAVYPFERLSQFVADLSERTGTKLVLPHVQKSAARLTINMLSPRAARSVRRYTRPDYDLLSDYYSTGTPTKEP